MPQLWNFIVDHQTALALGGYVLLSAAISALPAPVAASSNFYKWFYAFAQAIAANWFQKAPKP